MQATEALAVTAARPLSEKTLSGRTLVGCSICILKQIIVYVFIHRFSGIVNLSEHSTELFQKRTTVAHYVGKHSVPQLKLKKILAYLNSNILNANQKKSNKSHGWNRQPSQLRPNSKRQKA